jgi:dihydropteroate synthase|tara:strand:- start:71 stop:892 length:822 start_codon:yes stop_codon:yes gene_type:complete
MNINIRGNLYDLSSPKIMGILNVTPDSFYDGGKFKTNKEILIHVEKMINDGMDILDIGGYSSRPGAKNITTSEEIDRVIPVLKEIKFNFKELIISIDTFRSIVAKKTLDMGADIINDISAGTLDNSMLKTISDYKCVYIMMHMKGNPKTMQKDPKYSNPTKEIINYLAKRLKIARELNIHDLIIDPGFGFGKSLDHNFEILSNLNYFSMLEQPILAGFSRKSMIYKTLKINKESSINGTSALNTIALTKGVKILRVHDVKEAKECVILHNKIK